MPDLPSVDNRDLVRLIRRVFPRANVVSVEPASERLVVVYKAHVDDAVFYLRVAEEPVQDLTTDAQILERLRALGATVPAVVAAEAAPCELPLSWMLVTEIPGSSVGHAGTSEQARRAARLAGRDTAIINSVTLGGFGWVQRNGAQELTAELGSLASSAKETATGSSAGPMRYSPTASRPPSTEARVTSYEPTCPSAICHRCAAKASKREARSAKRARMQAMIC